MKFTKVSRRARCVVFFLVTFVLVVALPRSAFAQFDHRYVGTWKLNVGKSTFDPGPAPKSATRTYDGLRVTTVTVNADGTRTTTEHLTNWDGKDVPYISNPRFDATVIKRIDANTREQTMKKSGNVVMTARSVLSADGRVDTITVLTGTNASGRPIRNVQVWDKQ